MLSENRMVFGCLVAIALCGDPSAIATLYESQVDRRLQLPPQEQAFYVEQLRQALHPDLPAQYIVLVDRHPLVQAVMLFWKSPDGSFVWIGASPASTGKPGQFEYFATPLGVFDHTTANLDFRAEGTRNQHGIRGYGVRGMRVFDFGWVRTAKGWGDGRESIMRLQLHATDPDLLEPRLGVPLSKGCIRVPASLNVFLDRHGILDAHYELGLAAGKSYFVLRPDRAPVPGSGRYLVVVDSGRQERPAWSPPPRRQP